MAVRKAVASGFADVAATWDGGTLPATGDTVYTNNFIVDIRTSVQYAEMRSDSTTGVTGGGRFRTAAAGITITSNIVGKTTSSASSGTTLEVQHTCTIVGNVTGGASNANNSAVTLLATHTLTIVGNVTGGSFATGCAVQLSSGGTLIATNIYGGTVATAYGVKLVNVNGAVLQGTAYASSASIAVQVNVNGTFQGNSYGSASQTGVVLEAGAFQVGNSYGGTGFGGYGTLVKPGAVLQGNAYGGTGTAFGAFVEGMMLGSVNSNLAGSYDCGVASNGGIFWLEGVSNNAGNPAIYPYPGWPRIFYRNGTQFSDLIWPSGVNPTAADIAAATKYPWMGPTPPITGIKHKGLRI